MRSVSSWRRAAARGAAAWLAVMTGSLWAQASATVEAQMQAAVEAVQKARVIGPADIQLRDQAVLKLPAGYLWVPEPAAGQLMRAMGNHPGPEELGLVFPADEANWLIVAEYEPSGYIKDDDAKDWNVDDLFKSLKEGTEAANQERKQRGFAELEILGWVQKPTYDAQAHRLAWSMSAKHKGAPADEGANINYNTYALGREGFVSLNLITDLKDVDKDKAHAAAMLSALQFNDGKRYADFNASTDRVAEYGLAALVAGAAAKKLGFFAVLAAFFAKFAKVLIFAGVAAIAVIGKLFKRKQTSDA
jgi:uncharacterized membrane-anchored protein